MSQDVAFPLLHVHQILLQCIAATTEEMTQLAMCIFKMENVKSIWTKACALLCASFGKAHCSLFMSTQLLYASFDNSHAQYLTSLMAIFTYSDITDNLQKKKKNS